MKTAIQIPIKGARSLRVPNKNFRDLCGKPLAFWLLDRLNEGSNPAEYDVFIDTESDEVAEKIQNRYGNKFGIHKRSEWYASDAANGNHLMAQFQVLHPEYDIYAQLYITAVTLPHRIIMEALNALKSSRDKFDSVFLATEETGWYWFRGEPMNYNPRRMDGLPRSQDAQLVKETTGLYAITREALMSTGCRVGRTPYIYMVPVKYALDIDTMDDFHEAERILENGDTDLQ